MIKQYAARTSTSHAHNMLQNSVLKCKTMSPVSELPCRLFVVRSPRGVPRFCGCDRAAHRFCWKLLRFACTATFGRRNESIILVPCSSVFEALLQHIVFSYFLCAKATACRVLRTVLRNGREAHVSCKVESDALDLLQGKLRGASVKGRGWASRLGLTARYDTTVDTVEIIYSRALFYS